MMNKLNSMVGSVCVCLFGICIRVINLMVIDHYINSVDGEWTVEFISYSFGDLFTY